MGLRVLLRLTIRQPEFVLPRSRDSMQYAGLLGGDVVILEANRLTANGDIVVAVVDGQTTVMHLRSCADGGWLLEPTNPAYRPIWLTDSHEMLGVVAGSFRYRGDSLNTSSASA